MKQLDVLISIASDLTAALSSEERNRRLLDALKRVIPYDAAALLRLEEKEMIPVVSKGLSEDAMGRTFPLEEQPRLEIICRSHEPVMFPCDSDLPDPYDGLLAVDSGDFQKIHACLGCPLRVGEELIGVLTADAVQPNAFEGIDLDLLSAVGALAAAEMRTNHLIEALEQSAERQGLIAQDLMRDVHNRRGAEMIGSSPAMLKLRQDIELVAKSDYTVLITGETGVGKELVARAIHSVSARQNEPMLYVNCAALPESLAESELFGHLRGAFTGATSDRPGKFEVANRGTIFLDEIGELPLSIQPKLLRAIQQGEIQRIGADKVVKTDVRLIAATNRDLEREVEEGRFRPDLYHRLNVYPLPIPPLREKAEDIPLLAGFFCDVTRQRLGLGPVRLDHEAINALKRYPWPGNIRELENVISRVTLRTAAKIPKGEPVVIQKSHLGQEFGEESERLPLQGPTSPKTLTLTSNLKELTQEFQRRMIDQALGNHHGNWSAAATSLGMHRSNLHHLAKRLGLKEAKTPIE